MKRAWGNFLILEISHKVSSVASSRTANANLRTLLAQACANLGLEVLFTGDPSHSVAYLNIPNMGFAFATMGEFMVPLHQ